jgi:hypothetical protein
LFTLISQLIEKDSNRKYLYHFILFPNLSATFLKNQFSNLKVEEIDQILLEKIKSRLFHDYQTEQLKHHPKRYYKQIEINNHEGIVSALRKENPNSVSIEASSYYESSQWPINNLFQYNDSNFLTDHVPNSSICFSFSLHKVSISKYFIKSLHNNGWADHNLQHWKIEGSNDKSKWELIDSHQNETALNSWDKESTFECQPSKPFLYIKITQTGKNVCDYDRIGFSFMEFSGRVFFN